MSGKSNRVIYTGFTEDLVKRVRQHKKQSMEGFTKKYNLTKLIYYEAFEKIDEAIKREKQIKAGNRKKKEELINIMNPTREDLYDRVCYRRDCFAAFGGSQ